MFFLECGCDNVKYNGNIIEIVIEDNIGNDGRIKGIFY